ncbi:3-oxoacyl-[acyl-carrier-protein] synthase III [Streptomyces sp. 2231.1]|uniref:3-oxoacyl-ACP synthase III family protein n=1 Tax=Streptomyces sp. 2231.1 TaxID=1855347 RepID=UPI00089D6674|nr:beta-ketoacyl-ACP synthase 3 [Streptomyces sp. 2231.1]SEE25455.1 3-oxoacyl-[acyl-carrier-protein] synthase III [Streptomyces sp. 2231.1]
MTEIIDAPSHTEIGTGLRHPVGVLGTGLYVPDRVVTNEDLTRTLDTSDEWITSRTGIRERRFLEEGRVTSDMAVEAARQALADGGVAPENLDAIIITTFTPDQPLPSTAMIVKEQLGAHRAMPLDLTQAACAGGVYALLTGAHLLQNPSFENVLVIGADAGSRGTDPQERTTRVFLGDAAGAALLGRTPSGYGLLSWDTGDELSYEVQITAGGSRMPTTEETVAARQQYLQMNGKAVWNMATDKLPKSVLKTVQRAGVDVADVQHILLHQANLNIINEAAKTLGVPAERVPTTVQRFGNTAAASVFTVLHETLRRRARHGDLLVLAAIGAGFLWGSACFRHFDPRGEV